MQLLIPSIYWPIAKLGFSPKKEVRRKFRLLISNLYRKRVWNLLINFWAKDKGFDQRRYALQNNVHAFLSVCLLFQMGYWIRYSEFRQALIIGMIELVVNMPAIILSRYLFLITLRRPNLSLEGNGA